MCIYPHGSRVFMIARAYILLSLAARLTTVSLDTFTVSVLICHIETYARITNDVICIYPHGNRVFMIAHAYILLSLTTRLTTVSLDTFTVSVLFCHIETYPRITNDNW